MSGLLKGKVCIVTGASRGIGKAIAARFLEEGACVIGTAQTDGAIETWSQNETGGDYLRMSSAYFDITDSSAITKFVAETKKQYGCIDVLVNNAGVEYNELIGMISNENMEKMFRVNVFGMIQMLQMVSRVMAKKKSGSIINIASVVGVHGNPGQLVYSATKGAVISATKSAAKELAPRGIRVNAIAPGLTNTEMMRQVDQDKLEGRISNIKMGRIGEPEDVANACLFLASELSSYISGQIIGVDGCTVL